ncbi:hypothetical protein ANN_26038 [Periplaneta americana]|uniref:Uncharacterized protein n=1 Tax=Periplaneta americana TaxID=6978 RepID=A0ABQ8S4T2_PERAM|nr:hypothetical protein ANN_26038 [Periplaneta americana]
MWRRLTLQAKCSMDKKRNISKGTGGGPPGSPITTIEENVIVILADSAEPLENLYDDEEGYAEEIPVREMCTINNPIFLVSYKISTMDRRIRKTDRNSCRRKNKREAAVHQLYHTKKDPKISHSSLCISPSEIQPLPKMSEVRKTEKRKGGIAPFLQVALLKATWKKERTKEEKEHNKKKRAEKTKREI